MVKAHPRFDPGVAGREEDAAVVLDGVVVPFALPRLDAGPLDREAMVGESVLGEQGEVLGVARAEPVALA